VVLERVVVLEDVAPVSPDVVPLEAGGIADVSVVPVLVLGAISEGGADSVVVVVVLSVVELDLWPQAASAIANMQTLATLI